MLPTAVGAKEIASVCMQAAKPLQTFRLQRSVWPQGFLLSRCRGHRLLPTLSRWHSSILNAPKARAATALGLTQYGGTSPRRSNSGQ